MAGRVLFKGNRTHATRLRGLHKITDKDGVKLNKEISEILGCNIEPSDFSFLFRAICIVKIEVRKSQQFATRKDMCAQLRAMTKLTDDEDLIRALRNCDSRTFEVISQAQIDIISKIIVDEKSFNDIEGNECFIPPCIEFAAPMSSAPIYLPMGTPGLRLAIKQACNECENSKDSAGNKCKRYQDILARECRALWLKYKPNEKQTAWRSNDGTHSKNIDLAKSIFSSAGIEVGDSRIVEVINKKG